MHTYKLLLLRHYCASDERSEVTQTLGLHLFDEIGTSRVHISSQIKYYLEAPLLKLTERKSERLKNQFQKISWWERIVVVTLLQTN